MTLAISAGYCNAASHDLSTPSSASGASVGTFTVHDLRIGVVELRLTLKEGESNDSNLAACGDNLRFSGTVNYNNKNVTIPLFNGGGTPFNDPFIFDGTTVNLVGRVYNDSAAECKGYVHFEAGEGKQWKSLGHFVTPLLVPGLRTCGATVSDVDFGTVSPGTPSSAELTITKSGAGTSIITFAGKDLSNTGDLKLGGLESVIVRPGDTSYIDGDTGNWISGGAVNTIPLTLNAGTNAPGGKYSSNLTATLTCQ